MKMESKQKQSSSSNWSNTFEEDSAPKRAPRSRPETLPTAAASSVDVTKKFANAKAISSDMVFGGQQEERGHDANLSRFQGSSSISSAQYFGREEQTSSYGMRNILFLRADGPVLSFAYLQVLEATGLRVSPHQTWMMSRRVFVKESPRWLESCQTWHLGS